MQVNFSGVSDTPTLAAAETTNWYRNTFTDTHFTVHRKCGETLGPALAPFRTSSGNKEPNVVLPSRFRNSFELSFSSCVGEDQASIRGTEQELNLQQVQCVRRSDLFFLSHSLGDHEESSRVRPGVLNSGKPQDALDQGRKSRPGSLTLFPRPK